jgi:GTP-binding protein HflX
LEEADLLLEVVDISNPGFEGHLEVVENLLNELELTRLPRLRVFNKVDLVSREYADHQARRHQGLLISALDAASLGPLLERIEAAIGQGDGVAPRVFH